VAPGVGAQTRASAQLGDLSAEEVALIRRHARPTSRPCPRGAALDRWHPWISASATTSPAPTTAPHQPDRLGSLRSMMDLAHDGLRTWRHHRTCRLMSGLGAAAQPAGIESVSPIGATPAAERQWRPPAPAARATAVTNQGGATPRGWVDSYSFVELSSGHQLQRRCCDHGERGSLRCRPVGETLKGFGGMANR